MASEKECLFGFKVFLVKIKFIVFFFCGVSVCLFIYSLEKELVVCVMKCFSLSNTSNSTVEKFFLHFEGNSKIKFF